jgi:hypothetical protein
MTVEQQEEIKSIPKKIIFNAVIVPGVAQHFCRDYCAARNAMHLFACGSTITRFLFLVLKPLALRIDPLTSSSLLAPTFFECRPSKFQAVVF